MKRIYVKLNRFQGNDKNGKRIDDPVEWEMVIPVLENGKYRSPSNIGLYKNYFAFRQYLLDGETILVNAAGGWNMLSKTDHIIDICQK